MPTINGTSGNDILAGGAEGDTIHGLDGDDQLSGNAGNDSLAGGSGNDILNGGDGHDTVNGDAGNDVLNGNEGHDWLDGGVGADVMHGGLGNDQYIVDDLGDVVHEVPEPGSFDRVYSSISYVLPSDVEDLWLGTDPRGFEIREGAGSAALDGTGNSLDNLLVGNHGNNHLYGGGGNDDLRAGDGEDELFGGVGGDSLWGGAGNDILDGGEGGDGMIGGQGDDLYLVDNNGDVISEQAGDGIDTVQSSIAYNLAENVENLTITITGSGNTNYGGHGNASANTLIGIGAAFSFYGHAGDDRLYGSEGNDLLDGGAGTDIVEGGGGSDIYWIGELGDHVAAEFFDSGSSGIDEVRIASYAVGTVTLYAGDTGIERVALLDTAALSIDASAVLNGLNLQGNSYANSLTATAFADWVESGSGDDILTGGLGADTLSSGAGADTFKDTTAGLDGDVIDFQATDSIVITDASLDGFTFSFRDGILTYTGGSLTAQGGFTGQLQASAAAGGGVQLSVVQTAAIEARNDFNGDGRDDILWRNETGLLSEWLGQANGGFADNFANAAANVPTDWQVQGIGDFNGDGRDDILWRNETGLLSEWLGQANGGFADNFASAAANVPTDWQVQGTGDFNGDGRDDILWRNETGLLSEWLGQANGGFADNFANAAANVPTNWQVQGTGDFNGDGRDDILWRNETGLLSEWLGQANGGFADNFANAAANVPTNWQVQGTGDFNGDGRDDILWRNETGLLSEWLGQTNGGFADNFANAAANVPTNWQVQGIGDFNGDGRDDILWRNETGLLSEWLGQANGGFADNFASAAANVPTDWQVQSPEILWV